MSTRLWVQRGVLVLDASTDRVGVVMHVGHPVSGKPDEGQVFLRAEGGGREWEASVDTLRPAPSARLRRGALACLRTGRRARVLSD